MPGIELSNGIVGVVIESLEEVRGIANLGLRGDF